ncbi:sugar ABC transporter substrate-binding protein [Chloroflexi bacterium TSY]|nr:sugar ABC transporter substrate-binding protein [Chloroflexi bacterium TSY]
MTNHTLSRRGFLRLAGVTATVSALAACAPGAAPGGAAGDGAADAAVTEISFMGWDGAEEDEGVRAAIEVFQEEQPGISVNWLHTPENYSEKFLANLAAGTPPDTAFIQGDKYRTFIRDGVLMDITDQLEADDLLGAEDYFIQPQEFDRCTSEGRWYGIGSCWVAPHIYLNADVFADAGIDAPTNDPDEAWSWDHFVDVAKQLTVDINGNHPGDSGFDPDNIDQWGVHWPTWWIPLHSAIVSNGGDWVDSDTELLILDTPEATQAIQMIADLVLVHNVAPQGSAMQELGMSNTQMLENRKLAMAIDGSWALAWMHKIEATLDTAVLPALGENPATDMQAHLHSALTGTSHPEEAWEWVRFLSTPFYQTQFCKIGLWLPSQSALMTDEGLDEWITDGVHPTDYEKIATEFLPRFGDVLYQPIGWPEASAIINPALDAVWIGDKTAEEAMREAVPEANAILAKEQGKS